MEPTFVINRDGEEGHIKPHLMKRFEFTYDHEKGQWIVHVIEIHNCHDDLVARNMMYAPGHVREQTMKENRRRLLAKQPFSEYVRFVRVNNSGETWVGVMAFDIMLLTLNSRYRMSHEVRKMECAKSTRALICHGHQRQMCRVVSVDGMKKYLCDMNARIEERRIIKRCLLPWVFQTNFE